jgi:dihydroxy-acid dehydratase
MRGPIAALRDGDTITIDASARSIAVAVSAQELAARLDRWTEPRPRFETGVMAKYARLVSSAATGAVTG